MTNKKYINIFLISIKEQTIYRLNILFSLLASFFKILFAVTLWGWLFKENYGSLQYSLNATIAYYIISECILQLNQTELITEKISEEVQNGRFAKYFLMPINIKKYFFSLALGKTTYTFVYTLLSMLVFSFVFRLNYTIEFNLLSLIFFVLIVILGILAMKEINYIVGIMSIKYVDISVLIMIKQNVTALLVGGILPLHFFGENTIKVMKIFPFYYINYYPVNLLLTNDTENVFVAIIILCIWIFLLKIISTKMTNYYKKNYEGIGL